MAARKTAEAVRRLLGWYDANGRTLPWRGRKGRPDPYRVWLSEAMLQQTTAAAVIPYYKKFIALWPDVAALAGAPLDDVLAAWAGLGYYARARNLHKTAGIVAAAGGRFPADIAGLLALPGIGAYTAGAIAAIAYGAREAAMDANAERVIARLFAVEEALPGAKPRLHALAQAMVPAERPGDFAQALMDLGAGPCGSRAPRCRDCPLADLCAANARGLAERLPVKAAKTAKPLRRGAAFVARDGAGRVLLVRRPEKGLLGGMWQPPQGPWGADFPSAAEARRQAPFPALWRKCEGAVRHGFTHFNLEIEVYVASAAVPDAETAERRWAGANTLATLALPTVMRKILAHGLGETKTNRPTPPAPRTAPSKGSARRRRV
jgi:A/G-specific adenine glycosylase